MMSRYWFRGILLSYSYFYFYSLCFSVFVMYRKVSKLKKVCKNQVSKSCISSTLQCCTQIMRSREYGCVLGCRCVHVIWASFQCCFEKPFHSNIFFGAKNFFVCPLSTLFSFVFALFVLVGQFMYGQFMVPYLIFLVFFVVNYLIFFCLSCQVPLATFLPSLASVGAPACARSMLESQPVWCAQSRASVPRAYRAKRVTVVESWRYEKIMFKISFSTCILVRSFWRFIL